MARTALVETAAALNALSGAPTANAVDPTNGHEISFGKARRLVLRVAYTFAGAKTFTVKAGADGFAPKRGQGDLVLSLNNVTRYVVVESARFMQANGKCNIDIEAAATGNIEAVRLPAVS